MSGRVQPLQRSGNSSWWGDSSISLCTTLWNIHFWILYFKFLFTREFKLSIVPSHIYLSDRNSEIFMLHVLCRQRHSKMPDTKQALLTFQNLKQFHSIAGTSTGYNGTNHEIHLQWKSVSRSVVSRSSCPHGLYSLQALMSMKFSRQELPRLPFPSPGDLPDLGIKPGSPALASEFFTTEPPGKPQVLVT